MHKPNLNPDQQDEAFDATEHADDAFPQTVGQELKAETSVVTEEELVYGPREDAFAATDELAAEVTPKAKPSAALQALLTPKGAAAPKAGDAFSALMNRVRAKVAEDEQIKAERRLLATSLDAGGLNKAQRDALRAKILKWESEVEWRPEAVVDVLEHQVCACGRVEEHFYGRFQRQVSRRADKESTRYVAWPLPVGDFPREAAFRTREIPCCHVCFGSGYRVVEIDWEKFDSQKPSMVGGEPQRLVTKARPVESLETLPTGEPVQSPPPGTLTSDEEFEVARIFGKSLEHAAHPQQPPVSGEERTRLLKLLEKRNLGRDDLELKGNS